MSTKRKQLSIGNEAELAHHDRRQCNSATWQERLQSGQPSGSAGAAAAVDAHLLQPVQHAPAGLGRGASPLYNAIKHNDLALVRRLVEGGADINQPDPVRGALPLHAALTATSPHAMVRLLLSLGADVNARDARGHTALMGAAYLSDDRLLADLLVAGGDVAALDDNGFTALHHAAKEARYGSLIDTLVEAGADVDAKDALGSTPLHLAVFYTKWHAATALVAAGASLEARNSRGNTALDLTRNPDWKRRLLACKPGPGVAQKKALPPATTSGAAKQAALRGKLAQVKQEPEAGQQPDQHHRQQQQQQAAVAAKADPPQLSAPAPAQPAAAREGPAPGPASAVAVAVAVGPATGAGAPAGLHAQLQRLRAVLAHCRAAGQLDLDSAADYRIAFAHALSEEQRQEDLDLFGELAAAGKMAKLGDCVQRVAAMQRAREAALPRP